MIRIGSLLYDFEAEEPTEVAAFEGEEIAIIEDYGNGWTYVQKHNGVNGFVPTAYIDDNGEEIMIEEFVRRRGVSPRGVKPSPPVTAKPRISNTDASNHMNNNPRMSQRIGHRRHQRNTVVLSPVSDDNTMLASEPNNNGSFLDRTSVSSNSSVDAIPSKNKPLPAIPTQNNHSKEDGEENNNDVSNMQKNMKAIETNSQFKSFNHEQNSSTYNDDSCYSQSELNNDHTEPYSQTEGNNESPPINSTEQEKENRLTQHNSLPNSTDSRPRGSSLSSINSIESSTSDYDSLNINSTQLNNNNMNNNNSQSENSKRSSINSNTSSHDSESGNNVKSLRSMFEAQLHFETPPRTRGRKNSYSKSNKRFSETQSQKSASFAFQKEDPEHHYHSSKSKESTNSQQSPSPIAKGNSELIKSMQQQLNAQFSQKGASALPSHSQTETKELSESHSRKQNESKDKKDNKKRKTTSLTPEEPSRSSRLMSRFSLPPFAMNQNNDALENEIKKEESTKETVNTKKYSENEARKVITRNIWRYVLRRTFMRKLKNSEELKSMRMRNNYLKELVSTEESYVANLRILFQVFLEPLQQKKILSDQQISTLFSNIRQILLINEKLLGELKEARFKWPATNEVGDALNKMAPFLKVYTTYINNFDQGNEMLDKCERKINKFSSFLEKTYSTESHRLQGKALGSFLIQPVQRIPRYKLLLRDIIKHTPETHREYSQLLSAVSTIEQIASFVNESRRRNESRDLLLYVKNRVQKRYPGFIQPYRTLISDGNINLACGSWGTDIDNCEQRFAPYQMFLFSDMIVFLPEQNTRSKTQLKEFLVFLPFVRLNRTDADHKEIVIHAIHHGEKAWFNIRCNSVDETEAMAARMDQVLSSMKDHAERKGITQLETLDQQRIALQNVVPELGNEIGVVQREHDECRRMANDVNENLSKHEEELKRLQEIVDRERNEKQKLERKLEHLTDQQHSVRAMYEEKDIQLRNTDINILRVLNRDIDAFRDAFAKDPVVSVEDDAVQEEAVAAVTNPQQNNNNNNTTNE